MMSRLLSENYKKKYIFFKNQTLAADYWVKLFFILVQIWSADRG